eukprot:619418-Ditylum_brightwellii.AAC.1
MEMFKNILENKVSYKTFYEALSETLNLGIHKDSTNSAKIAEMLRYHYSKSGEGMTSLDGFIDCMDDKYFMTNFCNDLEATRAQNLIEIKKLY